MRGGTDSFEGLPSCRHLIKHNSERKEVRAGVNLLSKRLLRRSGTERRVSVARTDPVDAKERRTELRRKEYRRSLFNRRADNNPPPRPDAPRR